MPLLTGRCTPKHHRDYVRSEYIDALDLPDHTRATMYFDGHHKIVVYHNHNIGELYDLADDPGEFVNLWESAEHLALKADLLQRSYNASYGHSVYAGADRRGPM